MCKILKSAVDRVKIELLGMPNFRKIFRRSRSGDVPSPKDLSYDECRTQHSKRLFPILETLVQSIATKKRREELDAYTEEDLVFLKDIGYFENFRSSYPNVEVILDKKNKKLCLKGRGEGFEHVCNKCSWMLQRINIVRCPLPFEDTRIWDVIADSRVQEHIKNITTSKEIMAQISPGTSSNEVIITALNLIESEKAKRLFPELVTLKNVPIPKDADVSSEGEEFKIFLAEQERSKHIKVLFRTSDMAVEIVGMADAVTQAITELDQFFESKRVKRRFFPADFSPDVWKFLEMHFNEILNPKKEELSMLKVSVNLEKQPAGDYKICMTGIEKSFPASENLLNMLLKKITNQNKKINAPGLEKLFKGKNGQEEIRKIQLNRKVYIYQPNAIPRSATVSQIRTKSVYGRYNFTTNEGIKMSCKRGRIENQKADVLVNSALSNLNNFTACGKALKNKGGLTYIEACKPHTNIPAWNIACTPGGSLACQYVIHAVCCNWNKDDEQGSEKALRDLVIKIFQKCIELGASSLALPAIGAGKHGYPEDVVLKIIQEEVEKISTNNACQFSLKNVSVIVLNNKQPNNRGQEAYQPMQRQSFQLPQSVSPSQPTSPKQQVAPITTVAKTRSSSDSLKFGSVHVLLKEGDITKQKADAILNVLPKSIKLLDGGGVCKSLLKEGGQIIQDELDGNRRDSTCNSMFVTSAGSISNVKNILHFLPPTTDVAGLQASIEQCFHTAQQHSLNHVLIPAIGTANFDISPKSSADFILEAAKNFSKTNYSLTLEIVVFQKSMLSDFKKAIAANSQSMNDSEVKNNSLATNEDSTIATAVQSESEYAVDEIQLLFVGFKPNIDDAISDIEAFVDENEVERLLENVPRDFLHNHMPEVENLTKVYRVQTKCSATGDVTVEGLTEDVADFLVKFTELRSKYEMEKQYKIWLDEFSHYVQWYHSKDDQWVPFDKVINREIEIAYIEDNVEKINISINGENHNVDLCQMAMKSLVSGVWFDIERATHSGNFQDLPPSWDAQPEGKVVHLVTLLPSSSEYKDVTAHLNGSFKEGKPPAVKKIQRIQNAGLFRAYTAKKKSMKGKENEMILFHGTAVKNTSAINGNNFNRSFVGINGNKYGDGVYFTNDSSYSLRFCADQDDVGPHWLPHPKKATFPARYFQMYAVRVLIGDFTQGSKGLKVPPSKNDPMNPSALFDSLVNVMNNPSIFVIFQDHQCYPEYLITFTHV